MSLAHPFALKITEDGQEELAIEKIAPGDIIRILPGASVPMDGQVIAGSSDINMALISGESMPRFVSIGDDIPAGVLNGEGELQLKVTSMLGEQRLDKIANQVRSLLSIRTPMQAMAETAAQYIIPLGVNSWLV